MARRARHRRTPTHRDRPIALLFIAGSSLFAIASLPAYAARVDARAVGVTFVIGSILFTAAAIGQYLQVRNDPTDAAGRSVAASMRSAAWWAVAVQLVGTVMFNISTVAAIAKAIDTYQEANRLVWGPDVYGSIAFLIASHLAWLHVCGRLWCVKRESTDWWMAALNYVGSIFFMVSALAAVTLPTTGETLNIALVNSATFVGAGCFLAGAWLLLRSTGTDAETAPLPE
ncbi:MAG: YrhK family protein [Ornithinimicrobium sp.]